MKQQARLLAIGDNAAIENMEADYFLEILGGRKIKLRKPEMLTLADALLSALPATKEAVTWFPLPDRTGEYTEFALTKGLLSEGCIPERLFDAPGPGRPIELPGHLGTLCRAVGGVTKLAEMMQCSVDAISQWAKGERQPSGPARVLMNRIAEEYGLPTMIWAKANTTKDPE
jgi:hypothetical protein